MAISSVASLALLGPAHPADVVAWRATGGVSRAQFLADVLALAARLMPAEHALNLCEDRYRFMVGFAAVCLRGQTNLLPPSQAPAVLAQLAGRYPGCYALTDTPLAGLTVPQLGVGDAPGALPARVPMPGVPADHIAALAFTSGSTGEPRAHAKTWGSLVRVAQLTAQRFLGDHAVGANVVATVPAQHMYGLETTVMMALAGGCAAHAGRTFFPADLRAALEQVPSPRVLVTTPVHLRACLAAGVALPPVRLVVSATAPLAADLAATAEATLGAPVHEIYGCTEAGSMATRRTVGTPPWQLFAGMRLTRHEGVDCVHADHLPAPAALPDDVEDLGGGRFRLVGRSTDLVKVAGKRASLADLTARLLRVPGVVDGVVFMPDPPPGGEARPAALVVAPHLSEATILEALGSAVDAVFLPRPLVRVARLPRNAVGKLPQLALQAELDRVRARA